MYQDHNANKITGAGFNPRFGQAVGIQAMSQAEGVLSGASPAPMSPLQEYVQTLDARLTCLQNTLYLLSDRLVPVVYPATPDAASQSSNKDPSVPILMAVDAATLRLTQMQQLVENLLGRLVI